MKLIQALSSSPPSHNRLSAISPCTYTWLNAITAQDGSGNLQCVQYPGSEQASRTRPLSDEVASMIPGAAGIPCLLEILMRVRLDAHRSSAEAVGVPSVPSRSLSPSQQSIISPSTNHGS